MSVATAQDIRRWLHTGVEQGATHMLVICDTFDHSDYPVYVPADSDVNETYDRYHKSSMQRVMEVYDLRLDLDKQMEEARAFNF